MKGFFIEVTNNLLEPKHRKKMGTAVWEFMWCLDKITKIDEESVGWILGGKPIQLKDIRKEIGITEPKISKNLNKLKDAGYINIIRTGIGLIISVNKAQKRFNQKGKSDLTKRENQNDHKGKSLSYRQNSKTRQYDISGDGAPGRGKEVNDLIDKFKNVNPTHNRLFAQTGQRKAIERLLEKQTKEKLGEVIDMLVITNKMRYAPSITTPAQLENKIGSWLVFYQREKLKVEANKPFIV